MGAGIATGHYEIEHMAAVTFTRKAAAELRGRFQLDLERRLRTEPDADRRARLATALTRLERLFAGTIHAFCAHLLRERPVEAGIAPGFTELDDVDDGLQQRAAWRAFWERERGRGSARLAALAEAGLEPRDLDDAFEIVCRFPEVPFPRGSGRPPAIAPARRALEAFRGDLQRLLPAPLPAASTCNVLDRARDLARRCRVGLLARPAELADALARWTPPPAPTLKWWSAKAIARRAGALVAEFARDTATPFVAAWRQSCYRLVLDCLDDARREAAAARLRAVALNYGDLLQVAAKLLREREDVRAALQARFRWLFVDEFQDTDPIQAEVISLLAAAPAQGAPADSTRVALRPGALFVVGDPKQSIYRFRRADIETYGRVRARIEATGGEVVPLTTSFRSVPALCGWANTVFPRLFPRRATAQQPAFDRLDPVREAGDSRRTGIRQLVVPASVPKADVTRVDADLIARFIRAEVEAGRRQWGDFLILMCRKKSLARYAQALDALEIPVEVSGAGGFRDSPAVVALAGLLRALADPGDGPALIGVLRGPLFGLSDVELFRHRQAGRPLVVTAPLPAEASGPVVEALRALREMSRWTRQLPVPAAIERILEVTGWLAAGAAAGAGGAEAGHLLHAIDRIRRTVETGGTLLAAVEMLDEDLESPDVESVPLESGRRDVVRLMNLHKAKGLQGRVVFLADPLGALSDQVEVRIARDGSGAQGYLQVIRKRDGSWAETVLAEPAGWETHEATEQTYLHAERARLLYVAATRAQDLLVVSRWEKPGKGSRPWAGLETELVSAPVLKVPREVDLPRATRRPTLDARDAATTAREARLAAIRVPSWRVESVTGTAHRAAPVGEPLQAGRTREPDTGMAWGRLVHALLEHAGRGPRRDRAHLERVARWLTLDDPELRRVVPDALDTVEGVMASDLWQRALAAEELHAEVPFAARLDGEAAGDPPRVLHGVIDLAFRSAAGWELVDYKTDQADVASLVARYRDQIRQYSVQWAYLTDAPVVCGGLYSVREGRASVDLHGS